MKKSDFNARLRELCEGVKFLEVESLATEVRDLKERGVIHNVFDYGRLWEYNFELNLREDYKRKTTFTSDFSIAEWCAGVEGVGAITDTLYRSAMAYRDDIEYFAELLIALCLKSHEMAARDHYAWSKLYALLFLGAKDLFFDWFDASHPQHDEAMQYYFDYVD